MTNSKVTDVISNSFKLLTWNCSIKVKPGTTQLSYYREQQYYW